MSSGSPSRSGPVRRRTSSAGRRATRLLEAEHAHEPDQRAVVGEAATTSVRRPISLLLGLLAADPTSSAHPPQQPQRQALAVGRHVPALDRRPDARSRPPVPPHHRLRQARRSDRAPARSDQSPAPTETDRIAAVCADLGISPKKAHNLRRQLTLPEAIRARVAERPAGHQLSGHARQPARRHAGDRADADRGGREADHQPGAARRRAARPRRLRAPHLVEDEQAYAVRIDDGARLDAVERSRAPASS